MAEKITRPSSINGRDFKLNLNLDLLQSLRRNGKYCDLQLQSTVRDNKAIIPCHKIVLFTASPFFQKLLEKQDLSSFSFDSIDNDTLEALIKYIYSGGRISLRSETVCNVLDGAKKLGLKLLEEECMGFLRSLISEGTVVEILQYSRRGSYEGLVKDCVRFILGHLEEVKSHEFYSLGPESIKLLVEHQISLGFPSTEAILETVSEWLRVDEEERRMFAYDLIKGIPLWEIKIEALQRILRDDELMRSIPEVFSLYVKALEDSVTCLKEKIGTESTLNKRPSSVLDVAGPSKRSRLPPLEIWGAGASFQNSEQFEEFVVNPSRAVLGQTEGVESPVIYFVAKNGSSSVDISLLSFSLETKTVRQVGTYPYKAKSGFWLGYHGGRIFNIVFRQRQVRAFHVNKEDWDDTSFLLWNKIEHFTCILLGGFMYQIGGVLQSNSKTKTNITEAQRRNLMQDHSGEWEKVPKMNHAHAKAGVGVAGGKIYVIGGYQLKSSSFANTVKSVECYDTALNTWSIKRKMPRWKGGFAVATIGPYIYVLGGDSEYNYWNHLRNQGTMLDTVDIYDTEHDQWYSGVPMNKKRMHFSATAHNDFIYAIGGDNNDHPTVERYDTNQRIWEDLGPLPADGIYSSVAFNLQN